MFKGVIDDAKSAAASFIGKYLARAWVAVPFVVALGFATAAISLALTERFGAKNALWIMAAGFGVIGVLSAIAVAVKEREEAIAEEQESREGGLGEIGEMASAAASVAATQATHLPLGLLSSLVGNPSTSAAAAARLLIRNLPLVILLALLALLFWPTDDTGDTATGEDETVPPDKTGEPTATDGGPLREAA